MLLIAAPTVSAQGYAGLGTAAEGFALPDPDKRLSFPADHGPHPEFRIEWWYLTANLSGPDGTPYGIQWTLFRSALAPFETEGWDSPQIWLGHVAATAPGSHHVAERFARGGTGQAGVTIQPFEAWIDDWRMAATGGGTDDLDALTLSAAGPDFGYALTLTAQGPLVAQGIEGYSVKSPGGQASHYYSQPFYQVTGSLTLPGETAQIPVTGAGWLDREWSSQPLSDTQDGWDWASLHFDDGSKLMGFRLRDRAGQPFTSATWIAPDGTATPYPDGALTMTPLEQNEVNGAPVPTTWQIDLPDRAVSVRIAALNPQAWMATSFPYWEGPVGITGSHTGRGYLEMTGYGTD
jgi:predicted secreted hydrolase